MHIHIEAHGGLVSNPSDREIQETSALAAHAGVGLVLNVSNLSWVESHAGKRDIGHLNNRKLIDLSAAGIPIPAHLAKSTCEHVSYNTEKKKTGFTTTIAVFDKNELAIFQYT